MMPAVSDPIAVSDPLLAKFLNDVACSFSAGFTAGIILASIGWMVTSALLISKHDLWREND